MKTCQQCGRPATVRITDDECELYLCIDCNLKLEHAQALDFQRTAQQFNLAAAAFESMSGLPGLVPRMPVPPVQSLPIANMNVHNINVDNSVIGVLNTGCIESVSNAITMLRESGADEIASAISKLTQSVIDTQDASNESKNEILELLSVIADEARKPKQDRRSAVLRPLLSELATGFSGLAGLSQLWQEYGPMIQAFFS
jgi:hypothetical protein